MWKARVLGVTFVYVAFSLFACNTAYLNFEPRHQEYDVPLELRNIGQIKIEYEPKIVDAEGYIVLGAIFSSKEYKIKTAEYFDRELKEAGILDVAETNKERLVCKYNQVTGTWMRGGILISSTRIDLDMTCRLVDSGEDIHLTAFGIGRFQDGTSITKALARAQENLVRELVTSIAELSTR